MTYIVPPPHGPALPDALMAEVAAKLKMLAETGATSTIELRGLPLSNEDMIVIGEALGIGEVQAEVHVSGLSNVTETAWPGVWRVRHHSADGGIISDEIVIASVPDILSARKADIADSSARFLQIVQAQSASIGENNA